MAGTISEEQGQVGGAVEFRREPVAAARWKGLAFEALVLLVIFGGVTAVAGGIAVRAGRKAETCCGSR